MSAESVFEQARSLLKHVEYLGGPRGSTELIVTASEGFELLEWFGKEHGDCELFALDLAEARKSGDPYPMLKHFTVYGMAIRAPVVH